MSENKKQLMARTVQELYLYPYCSRVENVIRGIVWMASWLIGIVAQQVTNSQVLGGAYFIFSLSLLLEFVPDNRTCPISRVIHCLLCALPLIIMLLGSLLLSYRYSTEGAPSNEFYSFLVGALYYIGWIIFVRMLFGVILALLAAHTFIYDEEAQRKREIENNQEIERKRFMENLNGNPTGGQI